ncbi:GNAT family N-acetyltransferase [Oceanobacillus chungangensis]|uniref:GNAT family N-acetyltransferase n=1 Tax=Oceanobacillus chungangensis TaxID=1229152 RepID=A0A3D8PIV0_9BACI|nr:GNAT family N-acetyltransferase [Oceanobacillus chungangensis]RDW15115.1 GNAT family N-acetyltransferase [Oceanobacillus chungangensis]
MDKKQKMAKMFYDELISGNRITFIYLENNEFIGEGSLVFKNNDPDYTIPDKRIYLSRMIVKDEYRNRGVGGIILDYLIDYAEQLGYEEISLGVDTDNSSARHLYEKKGFTNVLYMGEDEYGEYVKLLKKLK